jgi:hypothetical protein
MAHQKKKVWKKTFLKSDLLNEKNRRNSKKRCPKKTSGGTFEFLGITPHDTIRGFEHRKRLEGGIIFYTENKKSDVPFFYIAPRFKLDSWQKKKWEEELILEKQCEEEKRKVIINPYGSGIACIMVGVKSSKSLHWRVKRLSYLEEDIIGEDLPIICELCKKNDIEDGKNFNVDIIRLQNPEYKSKAKNFGPGIGYWEMVGMPWEDDCGDQYNNNINDPNIQNLGIDHIEIDISHLKHRSDNVDDFIDFD